MTAPATTATPGFSFDGELWTKIKFTLLAVLLYRVGAHIAAPGVDVEALRTAIQQSSAAGFLAIYDQLGTNLQRATVFALGIMPYISASIVFQLGGGIIPSIGKMQKDEEGRKQLTQWTRYLAVAIALAQAWTFTLWVSALPGAMPDQRFLIKGIMVATLTIGAIFVMWLGEQITERGVGNGMSLLIAVSILERLWPSSIQMLGFIGSGILGPMKAIIFVALLVGLVAAVVAMSMSARRIPIQIPRKVMGRGRIREGQKTFIPIRLITAGVMPIIFAQTVILVPSTIARFTSSQSLIDVANFLDPRGVAYNVLFGVMIVVFSFFYTSIIFNSVDVSENLKKQGAFIPGVKPGSATADYIDGVLGRITLPGSIFLALLAILPAIVATSLSVQQFVFSGTSILIVVGVLLETLNQIEQHRNLRKYDGLMKTGRIRYRGRQSKFGM